MLIARCNGKHHQCRGMIAQALVERRAVIVIHRHDLRCSVQLNIAGTGREFSPRGLQRLHFCLEAWYHFDYFSSVAQPTAIIESVRARWVNLKYGVINSVLIDLVEILENLDHTQVRVIPQPVYVPLLSLPSSSPALFDKS